MGAFDAVQSFPALLESRDHLLAAIAGHRVSVAEAVAAIESDIALTIAVLRLANSSRSRRAGGADSVTAAVQALRPHAIHSLARSVRTFDFFQHAGAWGDTPTHARLHALSTQRAATLIAAELAHPHGDRLSVTSLLHDVGKLVLARAYPGYPSAVHGGAGTPGERARQERRELGVDHALIGGALIRRWGLPASLAVPVERHHEPDATGEAAILRLADILANYEAGAPVSAKEMLSSARAAGLQREQLRRLMYELPHASARRPLPADSCPLSNRERLLLKRLADGSVYKQIALELGLSVSTVRTHLHNVYGKLGAVNRAQAVITARERGWI